MLLHRICLLAILSQVLHVRCAWLQQLRHDKLAPSRNHTSPSLGGFNVQPADGHRDAGADADLPGLRKYKILYFLHVEIKKVFAYPVSAWWKDWKLWIGSMLWISVWFHGFVKPNMSADRHFVSSFCYAFGINIIVLHLLMYAENPQRGMEFVVIALSLQAMLGTVRELKAIKSAVTLVLDNVSYEALVELPHHEVCKAIKSKVSETILDFSGQQTLYIEFKPGCGPRLDPETTVMVEAVFDHRLGPKTQELPKSEAFKERLQLAVNTIPDILEVSNGLASVEHVEVEASGDNCIKRKEYNCDSMYMDMTLPLMQIVVLFIAQIGVWWFYFSSILWNLDLNKINYCFWMASFVIMQVTMIFNRGDDSVLGRPFPIVEWCTMIANRHRSITMALPHGEHPPVAVHFGGLIARGIMGYLTNTILREIMAFTIPLMLCSFTEPMDFVVYCVGVNFICTVDDMGQNKDFVVHTDEDRVHLAMPRKSRSAPAFDGKLGHVNDV